MTDQALVSVVIPTSGRPTVVRAVRSALAQVGPFNLEVVVAVDGAEDVRVSVRELLSGMKCDVLGTSRKSNANAARNLGIARAQGDFVALLDDDDEWTAGKISRQLEFIRSLPADPVLVVGGVAPLPEGKNWSASVVDELTRWPTRVFGPNDAVSEFLFLRERVRGDCKVLQSSTWFARRETFLNHPFDEMTYIHQDFGWLLDWSEKVAVCYINETLAIYRVSRSNGISMTSGARASTSLDWIIQRRRRVSRRVFFDFCVTFPGLFAERSGDLGLLVRIVAVGFKHGRPGLCSSVLVGVRLVLTVWNRCKRIVFHDSKGVL